MSKLYRAEILVNGEENRVRDVVTTLAEGEHELRLMQSDGFHFELAAPYVGTVKSTYMYQRIEDPLAQRYTLRVIVERGKTSHG